MSLVAQIFPDRLKPAVADLRHRSNWLRSPIARPTVRFVRAHGLTVRDGPFRGLVYPRSLVGLVEQLVPKLLASYELELHPALERLLAERYEQVVDVGAADGYYAVGLARALPGARVEAFEMNPLPARVCAELAEANGVAGRLTVRGECTVDELRALPDVRTLVFSDCEGCEAELLDPAVVPLLRTATVVVEMHPSIAPGVDDTLAERFRPTHTVEIVEQALRHAGDYPELGDGTGLDFVRKELLVSEFRPDPVSWAVMTPSAAA